MVGLVGDTYPGVRVPGRIAPAPAAARTRSPAASAGLRGCFHVGRAVGVLSRRQAVFAEAVRPVRAVIAEASRLVHDIAAQRGGAASWLFSQPGVRARQVLRRVRAPVTTPTPAALKDEVGTTLLLATAARVLEGAGGLEALPDVLRDDVVPPPVPVAPPPPARLDGPVGLLNAVVISVDDNVPIVMEVLELAPQRRLDLRPDSLLEAGVRAVHGPRQRRDIPPAVPRAELFGGEELEHGPVAVVTPWDPLPMRHQDMAQLDALDELAGRVSSVASSEEREGGGVIAYLARGVVSPGHLESLVLETASNEAAGSLSRCCRIPAVCGGFVGLCARAPARPASSAIKPSALILG